MKRTGPIAISVLFALLCTNIPGAFSLPELQPALTDVLTFSPADIQANTVTLYNVTEVDDIQTLANDELISSELFVTLRLGTLGSSQWPGKPLLPVRPVQFIVPWNAVTINSLDITASSFQDVPIAELVGRRVAPSQYQSTPNLTTDLLLERAVYDQNSFFPPNILQYTGEGHMGNFRIASGILYPITYNPVTATVRLYTSVTISVNYVQGPLDPNTGSAPLTTFNEIVRSVVQNPQNASEFYFPDAYGADCQESPNQELLIIVPGSATNTGLSTSALAYAGLRQSDGLRSYVRTLSEINATMGMSMPMEERIRGFLRAERCDTGVESVLLVGTVANAPPRNQLPLPTVQVPLEMLDAQPPSGEPEIITDDFTVPTDSFYARFDGSGDRLEDILVGRLPATTGSELSSYATKVRFFERANYENPSSGVVSVTPESYDNAFLIASVFNHNDDVEVEGSTVSSLLETELQDLSYETSHKYEKADNTRAHQVTNKLDDATALGPSIVTFVGPGGPNWLVINHDPFGASGEEVRYGISNFSSVDRQGSYFLYSTGNYNADLVRQSEDYTSLTTVAEKVLLDESNAVGTSTYFADSLFLSGLPTAGSAEQLFLAFGNAAMGYNQSGGRKDLGAFGAAHLASKSIVAPAAYAEEGILGASGRYAGMYNHSLASLGYFGDPTLASWAGKPRALTIQSPAYVKPTQSITVTILDGPDPTSGARVVASVNNSEVASATTNAFGQVALAVTALPEGPLRLTARKVGFAVADFVITVDGTPPTTVSLQPTPQETTSSWYSSTSTSVSINATDNNQIAGFSYLFSKTGSQADATQDTASSAISFGFASDGLWTLSVRAVDGAGNWEPTPKSRKIRVDFTPPVTSSTATSASPGPKPGWHAADVVFDLQATDVLSNISSSEYDPGAGWTDWTGPATYTNEGSYSISYRSADTAVPANMEEPKSRTFGIDRTAPAGGTLTSPSEAKTATSFTVSWTGSDALSGAWSYSLQKRENAGAWANWVTDTPLTSKSFPGQEGSSYDFRLAVRDGAGNLLGYGNVTTTSTYVNRAPIAEAGNNQEVMYEHNLVFGVNFNGTQSYDLDGSVGLYAWNFGDGQTGQGATVNHHYNAPGTYAVTLTVRDNDEKNSSPDSLTARIIVDVGIE